jgi:hypothetical protein
VQSALALHAFASAHFGHEPPQFRSVSLPFFAPSVQDAA